jgi:predicted nucleic acid-binding Zn ribbon protein
VSDRGDTNDPVEQADGLGSVLREVLGQGVLGPGISLGRLVRGWEEVVGTHLAGETAPRTLEKGVLTVAASSPGWAVQVRFLGREVAVRANQTLGSETVRSVRVVVRPEAVKPLRHKGSQGPRVGPERPPAGPPSDRI